MRYSASPITRQRRTLTRGLSVVRLVRPCVILCLSFLTFPLSFRFRISSQFKRFLPVTWPRDHNITWKITLWFDCENKRKGITSARLFPSRIYREGNLLMYREQIKRLDDLFLFCRTFDYYNNLCTAVIWDSLWNCSRKDFKFNVAFLVDVLFP